MAQASKVGKKTNKKTQSGRDVYETPEGEMVSEKSTTFKYKGKWINVPTIHKGKQYDDSTLKLMLDAEIIEPTSIHNSLESAEKAAQERTDSLEFNEGGAVTDEEQYLGYAEEAKNLAVDIPDVSFKDAATFVASATPVIGDAMAAKEVYDELQKDDPNYYLAGALGGAAIVGLVPGLGDAAANAIKAGARKAVDIGKRIEVDPNALGVMGGNVRLKPPVEEVTPQVSNIDYQKKMAEFDKAETADDWQNTVSEYVTESRDVNPTVRTPELEDSTKDLIDGKITREQHLQNVDKYKPVEAWDALPREPSSKATVFSLKPDQREKGKFILPDKAVKNLNVEKSSLKVGDKFNGRLDIPAYNRFDTWIVAGTSTAEKGVTHYAKAIHYKGVDDKPVRFLASQKTSEKIGTGEAGKTGYATVSGEIKDLDVEEIRDKAAKYLNDPEWTQVGFDPRRQGGFYVRSGENKHVPVREADEVIQIGPLVLAKNAKLDMEHKGYNEGGAVTDMEEEMNDMLLDEQVDPVSGNTAPVGALPSEVRDDIDIRVSENEYVIPAYAVRYFGEDFFDELLGSAKEGWERIKEGDELPFRDDELEVTDDDEEPKEGYAEGGGIPGEGITVPQPIGGGYGGYGGTGSRLGGFEFRMYINPETGRQMQILFFNGRPMKRIPQGFRPKGETVVEEQQQVQRERERDDRKSATVDKTPEWAKKQTKDWTIDDYSSYAESMKSADSDAARFAQSTILTVVGSLIGGTAGAIALPVLAKKAQQKQAESVNTSINNILKSGKSNIGTTLTNEDMNTLFKAQFEANTVDMYSREPSFLAKTLGITTDPGSSSGTPIYEQPFYQDDDKGIDIDSLLPPGMGAPTTTPTNSTSNVGSTSPAYAKPSQDPYAESRGSINSNKNDSGGAESASEAMERIQKENKKEVEKAQERIDKKEEKSVTIGGSRFG